MDSIEPTNRPLSIFLEDQLSEGPPLDRVLSRADEMLDFSRGLYTGAMGLGLVEYFRSGLLAHQTLCRLLAWRFGSVAATPSLLDFASGFGRTTRFLVRELAPERIAITEIKADAVEFQRQRFGVQAYLTTTSPESLPEDRQFGAVFAASFFTHLPERTFRPWLERLYRLVDDGCLFLFSTMGKELLPAGTSLPPSGIHFERVSESAVLSLDDYGTAWVSEDFVRGALAEISGGKATVAHLPRGLWHFQDLYVVVKGPADLAGLPRERGPMGYVEACGLEDSGAVLRLIGWTADPSSPEVPRVEATLNGGPAGSAELGPRRTDTASVGLAEARSFEVRLRAERGLFEPDDVVLVKAIDRGGRELVLMAAAVETIVLYTKNDTALAGRMARLEAELDGLRDASAKEIARLRARIAWMEASRFWRLRETWTAWKRRLGLRVPEPPA
ncbi:MAG: class I SAM-dependent methyltransferase [Thermoanaerobaculia bacterium]